MAMDESDNVSDQVYRLWRVHTTLMEMCMDRGYTAGARHATVESFRRAFFADISDGEEPRRDLLNMVVKHATLADDRLTIFFASGKVGVGTIRDLVSYMESQGSIRGVLVCPHPVTPSAAKAVRELAAGGSVVQVWEDTELIVNITKHELVPRHIVQSADEKRELLERYKLKEQQLPRIRVADPIAKYYGLRRGQVVKIIRENTPTAGRYVTYRMVY